MSAPTPPLSTAEKLLDALGSLGYLEESAASARLQAAFLGSSMMNSLRQYFPIPEGNEGDWRTWLSARQFCVFDDVDRANEIEQLGNASMAVVMTKMDDPWGFENLHDVFRGWQANVEKNLSSVADAEDKSALNELLAKYAYVWTAVVSPQGTASAGIDKTASLLLSSGALTTSSAVTPMTAYLKGLDPREGTIFDPRNLNAYRGVSHRIWNKWVEILNDQSPGTFWRQGLQAAENQSTVSHTSTLPVPFMKVVTRTTVHGPDLAVWHAQLRGMPYMKANSELNNVTHDTERKWLGLGYEEQPLHPVYRTPDLTPPTCFVPGTKIRTSRGDVSIEDLFEGDRVCTRLQPTQWGVRSCEKVKNVSPQFIYGFNNEPVFFTPGHVFRTSISRVYSRQNMLPARGWLRPGSGRFKRAG